VTARFGAAPSRITAADVAKSGKATSVVPRITSDHAARWAPSRRQRRQNRRAVEIGRDDRVLYDSPLEGSGFELLVPLGHLPPSTCCGRRIRDAAACLAGSDQIANTSTDRPNGETLC
jgi:hypothetical protein